MDLLTFSLKSFKREFYGALVINIVATFAAFLAGVNMFAIVLFPEINVRQTRTLLVVMILAAIVQTYYQKKLLKKLDEISDFEKKSSHYLKIYKLRLYWKCASCLSSCFIHLLTGRNIFLWFAVFDVLTTWTYFPKEVFIRREMKTEDLVFTEN